LVSLEGYDPKSAGMAIAIPDWSEKV